MTMNLFRRFLFIIGAAKVTRRVSTADGERVFFYVRWWHPVNLLLMLYFFVWNLFMSAAEVMVDMVVDARSEHSFFSENNDIWQRK